MRKLRLLLRASMLASTLAGSQVDAQVLSPTSTTNVERVADLLRFWTSVRLFGVSQGAGDSVWENALASASPSAFKAQDDAELKQVASRMLAAIDLTPQEGVSSPRAPEQPLATFDGALVISCPALGAGILDKTVDAEKIRSFAGTASSGGLVLDCRHYSPDEDQRAHEARGVALFLDAGLSPLLGKPVRLGYTQVRYWDGYPPDSGSTSGGYSTGLAKTDLGLFSPAANKLLLNPSRTVVIVDETTPDRTLLVAKTRAALHAKILQVGLRDSDADYEFRSKHLTMHYAALQTATLNGEQIQPDGCLSDEQDGTSRAVAVASLKGARLAPCNLVSSAHLVAASPTSTSITLGERMVALARLWGTIRYFHPYEKLNDRDWDGALEAAIPEFAAAADRTAYERAVMRLAARVDDSHVWMTGGTANPIVGSFAPPIYRRFIGNRLFVFGFYGLTRPQGLLPGDEIVAVDGAPLTQIEARYDPISPASTIQSRRDLTALLALIGSKDSDARLLIRRSGRTFDVVIKRTMSARETRLAPEQKSPIWRVLGSGIGYIDLTRLTPADADRALDATLNQKALILDMRGYPNGTAWQIAPRLAKPGHDKAVNALFRHPEYRGPSDPQITFQSFEQKLPEDGGKRHYGGQVIVLIDDRAVSQAEHSVMMFQAATPLTTVGSATTGANGDVTNVALPGGLSVSFSGNDVRHPDGSQLQRVGIKPDIAVQPSSSGLAAGKDEVLAEAIRFVKVGRKRH